MSKKKSKLQQAQDEAQAAINETNKKIEELGKHSNNLCIELNNMQESEQRDVSQLRNWDSKGVVAIS